MAFDPISYSELQQHKRLFLPHGVDGAGFHNSIYRGKFLGNEVTSEQWDRIADGTFRDMYIGDYWTINGTTYLIAAFNYYYNTGNTRLTTNHITLTTSRHMYTHRMNPTNTTEGGYVNSEMYTSGLDQAKTKIYADFAGHVLTHKRILSNAVDKVQLPLFALRPDLIGVKVSWWLRDVATATQFAYVNAYGHVNSFGANNVIGVRPVFSISG